MSEGLDEIDLWLRVLTSIVSVLYAVNKEFSMCDNYPKGNGDIFREWIQTYHSGDLLLHIEMASGSFQALAVEGSGLVYMNRPYWIDLLYQRMHTPGYNILQENILIILSSLEISALERLFYIIHITVCLSTDWLASNFHILYYYNFYVRSMGRMVGELETALEDIEEDGELILKEGFMMLIFQGIMYELPPFEKY